MPELLKNKVFTRNVISGFDLTIFIDS